MATASSKATVTVDYEDYGYADLNSPANSLRRSSSGYGGGHSGYGGGHSGYGGGHSGGYGKKKLKCCELVVDPLTFASILAFIGFSTFFLNTVITMDPDLPPDGRKKRSSSRTRLFHREELLDVIEAGKQPERE